MVANMIVIGSRIRDLSCEFCNSLKQIGARYDSDKLISAHDRQTLDVLLFISCTLSSSVASSVTVQGSRVMISPTLRPRSCTKSDATFSWPEKEFQPATALSLGPDLRAADKIAL
jgi:hypothetical protein